MYAITVLNIWLGGLVTLGIILMFPHIFMLYLGLVILVIAM